MAKINKLTKTSLCLLPPPRALSEKLSHPNSSSCVQPEPQHGQEDDDDKKYDLVVRGWLSNVTQLGFSVTIIFYLPGPHLFVRWSASNCFFFQPLDGTSNI